MIGSEGTLGIITAATMKLFPQPAARLTAWAAVPSLQAAVDLLGMAQQHLASSLTGFELMSNYCMQLVRKHFPQSPQIFSREYPQYILLELSGHDTEASTSTTLENLFAIAIERGIVLDVIVANSLAQSRSIWQVRENISAAQAAEGKNIKHDISLPASHIAGFISETDALLRQAYPHCRTVTFGHLGDGNLHYNVSAPTDTPDIVFILEQAKINQLVHDSVHRHHGSISAEHGLGAQKKEEILRYKSPLEIQMMRSIKSALDPHQIMNPGKVL